MLGGIERMSRQDPSLTIRNEDLSSAVRAGVLDEVTAGRLADFVSSTGAPAATDEEHFRLITGFNDIFVAIGLGLFFGALLAIFKATAFPIMAASAWVQAEIFTRRMRMALPSIILLLVFVGMVFWTVFWLGTPASVNSWEWFGEPKPWILIAGAAAAALAAALHWWRFRVPITVAAGMAACAGIVVAAIGATDKEFLKDYGSFIIFPLGLAVFALAMFFDRQDRARRTQLSDRAFWLHLLAAPMIVHPLVLNMVSQNELPLSNAILIVALFLALGFVALVADRRALLVSSLTYLGYALYSFIGSSAFGTDGAGIAVLSVGVVVLLLSVAWKPLRVAILPRLPAIIQLQVPYLQSA